MNQSLEDDDLTSPFSGSLETAQTTCPITTQKKCNINGEGVSTGSADGPINFGIVDQGL